MIRTLLAVIAALTLAACASGPSEPDFPPGPALFVARDADSTMYLFGTLQIRRPNTAWGGARAQAGLAETEEIWTELEISPETDAQTQSLALRYGMSDPDRPLSSYFSAEEYARINAVAQRFGVSSYMLDIMRPWLAGVTFSVLPMTEAGYDPAAGADRAIDAYGDAHGKTMRAFETAEAQIQMLAGMSDAVQRQMVLEAVAEVEEGSSQMDAMATAWETGDLRTLERFVVTETRNEYPEVYQVLLVQRNNAWLETLTHELEGAGVDFVAVGAAHMLGPDGLVAQLRARGYEVERVE